MGPLGWVPFGAQVAGLGLFVSAVSYLVGFGLTAVGRPALRVPTYAVSAIGAAVCLVLARNWPDRAAALALLVTTGVGIAKRSGDPDSPHGGPELNA